MTEVVRGRRVLGTDVPGATWIAHHDGVIVDVGGGAVPRGARDLGEVDLAPGFVDLQVNGIGPVDFATATSREWDDALLMLEACGVTACCPTFVSAPLADYDEYLACTERAQEARGDQGAAVLGAHLEGPFLGGAPGAHDPSRLVPADAAWLADILDRHPGVVRVMTLAPEADPDGAAVRALVARGVVVSLGHSTASYEQAWAATDAGARMATHLFNGMAPFHHREPGIVGAALDRLVPSVIADLVHVHPAALRAAIARKREIVVVSDQVADGGAHGSAGAVTRDGGVARLPDGTLAGSCTPLDQGVRNLVWIGIPVERAVEMASTIPAEVLGLDDRGRIAVGRRADVVALDGTTLAVTGTLIGGIGRLGRAH